MKVIEIKMKDGEYEIYKSYDYNTFKHIIKNHSDIILKDANFMEQQLDNNSLREDDNDPTYFAPIIP